MNAPAPAIAPEGVTDIIAKLAALTFDSGMDVSMDASFGDHGEHIIFALVPASPSQITGGRDEFIAAVRANQEEIAGRLATSRSLSQLTGEDLNVDLAGLSNVRSWPILSISTGLFVPESGE
ncbi:MAG TPA: hypothetical protein VF867_19005 [Arthrobacter sp.]